MTVAQRSSALTTETPSYSRKALLPPRWDNGETYSWLLNRFSRFGVQIKWCMSSGSSYKECFFSSPCVRPKHLYLWLICPGRHPSADNALCTCGGFTPFYPVCCLVSVYLFLKVVIMHEVFHTQHVADQLTSTVSILNQHRKPRYLIAKCLHWWSFLFHSLQSGVSRRSDLDLQPGNSIFPSRYLNRSE